MQKSEFSCKFCKIICRAKTFSKKVFKKMNHHVTLFFMFAKLKSTSKIKNYSEVKLDYRLCKLDKKNW